ncbi:MAG: N-acetylmuramoyl-L-alanine amidase, partial [Agathobacter sp.]
WYPIGNGDRDTEPDINLQNCLAAKKYLEQKGYTVRLTRSSNNENPSITQRLTYCYPSQNTSASPDADAFVCVHSNAGGGSGTSYISLSGDYDQKGIPSDYAAQGNALGRAINDKIAELTDLSNSGSIDGEPELIAFCKSPVICAYLEIGFFDNSSDLSILKSDSDTIGRAIAEGIDSYFN